MKFLMGFLQYKGRENTRDNTAVPIPSSKCCYPHRTIYKGVDRYS